MKNSIKQKKREIYNLHALTNSLYANSARFYWEIGRDSPKRISLFLKRNRVNTKELFEKGAKQVNLVGGVLSLYDESYMAKCYMRSKSKKSSKHKKEKKLLDNNIMILFYMDMHGVSIPVNYRVYSKKIGKTKKNDYYLEMLKDVFSWGLRPDLES